MDNLPVELTSFVDRQRQLAEIKRTATQWRLLTLTGTGGVGKTRLAVQAARELRQQFRDGVWLVELAPLGTGELLAETVAATLRVRESGWQSASTALTEFLHDKRLLLLLDNCEHVVSQCAELVATVLQRCQGVQVLATSRQPLGVSGEWVREVPSLSDNSRAQSAERSDVRLFADRAAAVSDFALTADTTATVAQLCERLEGNPLAIELAAVQLRHLSLDQIMRRLEDPLSLTGPLAAPERQQTLRALLNWSYTLCSPEEQQFWARVSVFAGPFDLQDAEEVCAQNPADRDGILDGVFGLVEKSIILSEQHGATTRYRLLDTVRQYGQELLDASGQRRVWRQRHRDHYLRLAERAEADWFGPDQGRWAAQLQADQANLREALDFCCVEPNQSEAGLRIGTALRVHWVTGTGYLREGRRWLDRLLAVHREPTCARARGLWVSGWLALLQNDVPAARSMLAESRALATRHTDFTTLAYVTQLSGAVEEYTGNLEGAIPLLEEALNLHNAVSDRVGVAFTLSRLASVTLLLGQPDRAANFCERSIAMSVEFDEAWSRAHALWLLGMAVWLQGDSRRAATLEQESIRFKTSFDDLLGIAVAMEVLAWITAESNATRAATLLGAVHKLWQTTGLSLLRYMRDFHDTCVQRTKSTLGEDGYAAAFDKGSSLSLQQAVRYAAPRPAAAPVPEPAGEPTPLTSRQTQVAELIAEGLTNRQIANRLSISPRTTDAHVEEILSRLDFSSRAQVAAWITDRQHHSPAP